MRIRIGDHQTNIRLCHDGEITSNGVYHFSTDIGTWKYDMETELWTIGAGGWISTNKDEELWRTEDGSTGRVRKYDEDGNLINTGSIPKSVFGANYDSITFESIAFRPDDGCVAGYNLARGAFATYAISGWDSDGTGHWIQKFGNDVGNTQNYVRGEVTVNSDNEIFVMSRSVNSMVMRIYKLDGSDGSIITQNELTFGSAIVKIGWSAELSPDSSELYALIYVPSSNAILVKIDTSDLSATSYALEAGTDFVRGSLTVNKNGVVYYGVETSSGQWEVRKINSDFTGETTIHTFSSDDPIVGIAIDTFNRVFVMIESSDGFGGFGVVNYFVNTDGSFTQISTESGRAKSLTVHPSSLSILP